MSVPTSTAVRVCMSLVAASMLAAGLSAFAPQTPAAAPKPSTFGTWGVDLAAMDRSVRPGDDFDRFITAAGRRAWKSPPISRPPAVFTTCSTCRRARRTPSSSGRRPRARSAACTSFMNEETADVLDAKPLQPDLKRLAGVADKASFTAFMGRTSGTFGTSLFGLQVGPDPVKPDDEHRLLGQAGSGPARPRLLPDSDSSSRSATPTAPTSSGRWS